MRKAAATARQVLINLAATQLDVPSDQLNLTDGVISSIADPRGAVSYADLVGDRRFEIPIDDTVVTKDPNRYTVVGQPIQARGSATESAPAVSATCRTCACQGCCTHE